MKECANIRELANTMCLCVTTQKSRVPFVCLATSTPTRKQKRRATMTEHKFTDEEVIKALECCMRGNHCEGYCPYDDEYDDFDGFYGSYFLNI